MRKIKYISLAMAALLLALSPLAAMLGAALFTPPVFEDSFVGALDGKFERLTSIEGEKIVVVGGSSVAFGLDSAALEEYTGMPVVNFGLYAALGTKVMLDLSLAGIGEGDVVILSPETDPEALSLYFGADTVWRAIDGEPSMLGYIDTDNMPAMLGALWGYASSKVSYATGRDSFSDSGVYLSKYFNEYGDFAYPRAANTMQSYYERNNPIRLDISAYGAELDGFIDYLNAYVKKCEARGAAVYFSFSPMNEMAIAEDERTRAELVGVLEERLNCPIISDIESCIFEAGYFFDTNFHLNDAGVTARTIRLAKDIRLAEGIVMSAITTPEPEAPALPELTVRYDGYDENSVYFTYARLDSGGYAITGLTEEGREMTSLTVPKGYGGYIVEAVAEGAFSGSRLESLTVPADSSLAYFENGAFLGAAGLRDLWIYKASGDDLAPPESFAGVHRDFRVHVPEGSDFSYHYYWSERGLTFVEE
ncbi:MAG: hypothetical protein IJW48_02165 [Clostridia bacterium]|nr:hypothetical protein [Clostridia bacterium]